MSAYEAKIKRAQFFAEAIVPDGYFGDTCKINIGLLDGYIIAKHDRGLYKLSHLRALDLSEAQWLLKNHPDFKHVKVTGGAE